MIFPKYRRSNSAPTRSFSSLNQRAYRPAHFGARTCSPRRRRPAAHNCCDGHVPTGHDRGLTPKLGSVETVRVLLLARHGQSLFNVDGVVNGDPALDRGLSPLGADEARSLAGQVAGTRIDLCVTSQFPRAQQTARLALGARASTTPTEIDDDLNDIRIGELEGRTLADYRAWKHAHTRRDRFTGGES